MPILSFLTHPFIGAKTRSAVVVARDKMSDFTAGNDKIYHMFVPTSIDNGWREKRPLGIFKGRKLLLMGGVCGDKIQSGFSRMYMSADTCICTQVLGSSNMFCITYVEETEVLNLMLLWYF